MMSRRNGGRALVTLCLTLVAAIGQPSLAQDATGPIVIGSKNFAENRILAQLMAQMLEAHTDYDVQLKDGLGGTLVAFEALRAGEIDVYPEYTGTAWAVILKEQGAATDPLRTYVHVDLEFNRLYDVDWLPPFGFSNSYALAVTRTLAESLNLKRLSDLAAHSTGLRAGVSHEFLAREDGWPGLAEAYNLRFDSLRGMDHGLTFEALRQGELDIVDVWTTDGKLQRFDLAVLEDDLGFWPPYQCAPIVRADLARRAPGAREVIERLALRLPEARMQELNGRVEVDGLSFYEAARSFLLEEGLLGDSPGAAAGVGSSLETGAGERRGSLSQFMASRLGVTGRLIWEHLLLTISAVLTATLLSLPLGVFISRRGRRRQKVAGPVLALAGVIQTIPGLALLAFMIPWLGLGLDAAYAALVLYALLPILRNTYAGLMDVDPDLIEAATGMGLTPRQTLRHVELPLARPTIMAGIRTATVITLGVATLAAFIGAGGLGEPIVTGLALNDTRLILSGAVPAALLAILADAAWGLVERHMR